MPFSPQGNDTMAITVTAPDRMNAAFADAFNSRSIANLLQLYEPDAVLRTDANGADLSGLAAIGAALAQLLQAPGQMTSRNHFCIVHGDLALLRADWVLATDDGAIVAHAQHGGGILKFYVFGEAVDQAEFAQFVQLHGNVFKWLIYRKNMLIIRFADVFLQ